MKVMVTGHRGYIGSVLVPMLLRAGHTVKGVDSNLFVHPGRGLTGSPIGGLDRRDVRRLVTEDVHGLDAVVHLAALSNDPMGQLDPRLTDDVNHLASVRLAKMAREVGVRRFVFSSSCSLYGAADTSVPVDETAPFNPVTAYAQSKIDTEEGLRPLANNDFSPVFLRNATAFGLSPAMRFDLVVNNLVGWALTTRCVQLMSDGSPWRPLVHVSDIARACIAAIEAPRDAVHNESFNIGRDDQNFQVRDIAHAVQAQVRDCSLAITDEAEPDTRSYKVNFSKVASHLPEFRPEWTMKAGIREIVEYFRQRGLSEAEFQGREYVRLEQLRYLIGTSQLDSELYWRERLEAN